LLDRLAQKGAEPSPSQQETIRRLVAPASFHGDRAACEELEKATRDLPNAFPEFALGYVWRSIALGGLARFSEAFEVLQTGLDTCPDPLQICAGCAHICEQKGSMAQFGWHMQQCFLGTDSYWPYLVLAQAALSCDMQGIAKPLLGASDVLCPGWETWRLQEEEVARIDSLVRSDLPGMRDALTRFAECMEPTFTKVGTVPDDPMQRSKWLRNERELRSVVREYLTTPIRERRGNLA
jgi:hypothetical protein